MMPTIGMCARVAVLAALALAVPHAPAAALSQEHAARRVVSLVPAATETLFALGAGDRVVGVSSYDRWPAEVEALPRVGALLDPDTERILTLDPDLVVVDPSQRTLASQLASVGIEAFTWPTADIEDYFTRLGGLGRALGMETEAAELERALRAELAAVAATAAGRERVPTLLVFGRRPGAFAELWVSGGVGFLHELVEIAGGDNLFGHLDLQSFKAGLEVLVADPPAVVVETTGADVDAEAIAAEWRSLPGFANVSVGVLEGSGTLVPGPRMGETARRIAAAVAVSGEGEQ